MHWQKISQLINKDCPAPMSDLMFLNEPSKASKMLLVLLRLLKADILTNTFICVHTEKAHPKKKKPHTITITFGNNTKACIWVPQWTWGLATWLYWFLHKPQHRASIQFLSLNHWGPQGEHQRISAGNRAPRLQLCQATLPASGTWPTSGEEGGQGLEQVMLTAGDMWKLLVFFPSRLKLLLFSC